MSAWASMRPLTRRQARVFARAKEAAAKQQAEEERQRHVEAARQAALAALPDPRKWLQAAPSPIRALERAIVLRDHGRIQFEELYAVAAAARVDNWSAYARSWWEASRWRGGGRAPEDVEDEARALGLIL